jgi:hypothetical protein
MKMSSANKNLTRSTTFGKIFLNKLQQKSTQLKTCDETRIQQTPFQQNALNNVISRGVLQFHILSNSVAWGNS